MVHDCALGLLKCFTYLVRPIEDEGVELLREEDGGIIEHLKLLPNADHVLYPRIVEDPAGKLRVTSRYEHKFERADVHL